MNAIVKGAALRLAKSGDPFAAKRLFTDRERRELADLIASASATGELMGRAGVRLMAEREIKKHSEQFAERDLKQLVQAAADETEEPTEAQKESGNYRKGHVSIQGLPITIETARGQTRSGKDKDGKAWKTTMAHHYGYIKRTESEADGDHVDVFIGPNTDGEKVFIVDQLKAGGAFDEHKVMLGFSSPEEAKDGYLANYEPDWKGFGGMSSMDVERFKAWLKEGDTGRATGIGSTVPVEGAKQVFAEGEGKPCGDSHIAADKECRIGQGAPSRKPSIGLKRVGKEWRQEDGSPLPDHLKKFAIPPAWKNVRVNPEPSADLQITGVDAKGRVQSRYSESHDARQAVAKFKRISELMDKEKQVVSENDAAMKSDDPVKREAAAVTALIFATGLRPGSERDTGAEKQAYGATTLEGRHVVESPSGVRLIFVGKKGVDLDIPVQDKAVASMLVERKRSAGNSGKLFKASDADLRDHVHSLDGGKFKPKDLRTLRGTSLAAQLVSARKGCCASAKEYKKAVNEVADAVSQKLGNTRAIALKAYISPAVFTQWRVAQ